MSEHVSIIKYMLLQYESKQHTYPWYLTSTCFVHKKAQGYTLQAVLVLPADKPVDDDHRHRQLTIPAQEGTSGRTF